MTQPRIKSYNHRAKDAPDKYNNESASGQLKILERQIANLRAAMRVSELSDEAVANINKAVRLMDIR